MKVIVDYNPKTGMILVDGTDYFVGYDLELPEAESQKSKNIDVLALARQGYSAQDLVELRKQDII